ncbi:nesprin-2 isoform X2 [Kryptolebias marmoratus]|uniref:nesprin-2 isoform X2 n=1 Tax=Kryptolebias marmoratus TaxID=37003 RepID=UPI0018AC924E|nr:nesprin-2 isoform X2 [Kryptolebias marmoratus]
MASGGAKGDGGGVPLDIDDLHTLLQVELEQIQKRTFTNWINSQLAKRCPPSYVSDLFLDLRDGLLLLDLLEVMSSQSMIRHRGRGIFQQRANIETALNFLKQKSIKLVNINIPDIIDGRPAIILGLIWIIILHCHIEELAGALSLSSRHSSLDSLASLDSWSSSPVPAGRTSPLHRRFRVSAKKALLMWVRDQCQKVHSSVRVKDFQSSWRSGEAFLAILCSLRPELVDLSPVRSRSNQENLEEAFHLAERELHIPRLLEPQDVNVKNPDEKSIMTYVAQFLQYSNDTPGPDDHLELFPAARPSVFSPVNLPPHFTPALHQASPSERAQEVTSWLQQTSEELSEARAATERSSYAEKYQVFQSFAGSFDEQRRPVMTLLAAVRRRPELRLQQQDLKTTWDRLEEELRRFETDLERSLPRPLDSVVLWLQRAETVLKGGGGGTVKDPADAAKEARAQQDKLKTLLKEMNHYVTISDTYHSMDDSGNPSVPHEKLQEIKNRLTDVRVMSNHELIELEYQESRLTVLDLLRSIRAKVQSWMPPYGSQEAIHALLQDWHETVEHQGVLLILMDALQNLKERMNSYTSRAPPGEDFQRVTRQVKEAERETELIGQEVTNAKGAMERVESAWKLYNKRLGSLQARLTQPSAEETPGMSEWTSCHAQLNEAGNFLIETTETPTSLSLSEQLSRVNLQWAECMKKMVFEAPSEARAGPSCLQIADSGEKQRTDSEDGKDVGFHAAIKIMSQPFRERVRLVQFVAQTSDGAESEPFSELRTQASSFSQNNQPAKTPTAAGSTLKGSESLDVSKPVESSATEGTKSPDVSRPAASSVTEGSKRPDVSKTAVNSATEGTKRRDVSKPAASSATEGTKSPSPPNGQNIEHKSRAGARPNAPQGSTAAQPPVVVRSEVLSKAQSMARSRLEKARVLLQGRIQQAVNLFSPREMTESQVKKKQKALKVLQPALLEEFLGAVEGFGAFCSGPQLQDLMLLSDSVRKQWEDVRREMAAFVHSLKSNSREGKRPFSVLQSEMFTNRLHEAADQTDHDSVQQQQAVTQGSSSVEGRFDSLRELCESLTAGKSSSLATNQQTEETQAADTALLPDGRSLKENASLNPPKTSAEIQPKLTLKPSMDRMDRMDRTEPGVLTVHVLQDVPAETEDPVLQTEGCGWEKEPPPEATEQLLKARLLNAAESSQQTQTHIQAVVRSDTVERKQEAEWTFIPPQEEEEEDPSEQDALTRMSSSEKTSDLMESEEDQKTIFTEKLNQIISQPLDVSSLTLADSAVISDLKELDETLKIEIRKLSEQRPKATSRSSVCQPLHSSIQHLEQLRQLLNEVQSVAQALDRFLDTLRDIKAEIPTLLANQDPSRHESGTNWEEGRYSWQTATQRLKPAMKQSHVVDGRLKAVGMTLNMDGASVTCQEVVESVSKLGTASGKRTEEGKERGEMQGSEVMNLTETQKTETGNDSEVRSGERRTPSVTEEKSGLEAKRRKREEENKKKTQREEVHKTETWWSEEDQMQRRSSQTDRKRNENESLVQRRAALLAALKETKEAAEQLELQELTLPALQHRMRVLTELESPLSVLVSEVQSIREASSQSGVLEENQTREVQDLWEETTKAITKRLEQCSVLTELLKKFQSRRSELSGTLQRAESTISQQASYIGKDYLQRLHSKVEETKSELNGLGDNIEEVRSVCRQIHSVLRRIPRRTETPFEREADALMDRWLDLSERTESHYENLHLCVTLWDGVLQLGAEVESWADSKLALFAQSPCFQSEGDFKALQDEIIIQEERAEHFHRRAAEIQSLLQSTETPLELQLVETQMRKKVEQLKELVSESEDVYKQMEATHAQIVWRITECLNSLQKIQDSLGALTAPDVPTVSAKLEELRQQLRSQDKQAQSLMEDAGVMASIAGAVGLRSLSVGGVQLEEEVRSTHQLFSEVEQQTERNIQDLHRLQTQKEHLERWLHAAEEKALKGEDLGCLREEALQQSVRTELIAQLVSSLRSSNLQQAALLEQSCKLLERYRTFRTGTRGSSEEERRSLSRDAEKFQTFFESTQSWTEDSRQTVKPPLVQRSEIRTPVEQKLHCAQGSYSRLEEGLSNEEHFGQLLQDCHHNLTTLQEEVSVCQEQKDESGGLSTDGAALEALLEDVTDVGKDVLQLGEDRKSLTAEARASITEQLSDLQNQKGAMESSIKEHQQAAPLTGNQTVQKVGVDASLSQTELRVLAENVENLPKVESDLRQLTQRGCIVQDCERRMTEVAARVNELQRTRETQETPPADDILTVGAVCKDLDSNGSAESVNRSQTETTSFSQMSHGQVDLPNKSDGGKEDWASPDSATGFSSPADSDPDSKSPPEGAHLSTGASRKECEATERNPPGTPDQKHQEHASTPVQATCSESPDVLRSEAPPSASQEFNLQAYLGAKDDGCKPCINTQNVTLRTLSESLPAFHKTSLQEAPQSAPFSVSDHLPGHADTSGVLTDAQEPEKHSEITKEVFTVALDMQRQEHTGAYSPDVLRCSAELHGAQLLEKTPGLITGPTGPEADFKSCAHFQENGSSDKVFTVVLELQEWDKQQSGNILPSWSDVLRRGAELNDAEPAEMSNTRFPENKSGLCPTSGSPESNEKLLKSLGLSSESNALVTDFCQSGEQTESSALCAAKGSDAPNERLKDAADRKHPTAATAAEPSAGEEVEQGGAESCRTPAGPEHPGGREETVTTPEQPQIQEGMEPERTAPGFPAEVTDGSPESHKPRSTMQEAWSEIQGLLERSNIINRTPHPDLNWSLKASPVEADIRLARTVQHVLACRYQPARLHVTTMATQLKEAQDWERIVQEQVAAMKNNVTTVSDPNVLKRAEKQWSAALLDASATVQVKTAQVEQVKQHHRQVKITKAFLQVLASEKEKSSLTFLGGSGLQAEKLHALLQTLEKKKPAMDGLLSSSSKLSVHLSDAESSGALLAQLRVLQEDWRLLKGSIKRALQQASSAAAQSSLVLKEAKQLRDKLLDFLDFETDSLSSLELVCLTTDLKLYNQLYLSLQSQADALVSFSLGQKEKEEIEQNLQELGSLFNAAKKKLDAWAQSCGSSSLNKINKQLRDLIVWAKQAENHISTGQKLALFPEEARIQIAEMRKFQTDILSRRRKMRIQVEEMKGEAANVENEDGEVLKTVEDLYETIADSLDQVLDTMKQSLSEREELLSEFARLDAWLAETHANRDPCTHTENVSEACIAELESELKTHRAATVEIRNQLKLLDALSESCSKICVELSPGESRFLITRLSGLWTELDGLLAHENATIRELEELIHERTSSDEELSTVQDSLKQISADLEQQKFPLTLETLSMIANLKHKLMEHQCQVQGLQHCREDKQNSLLLLIGELQDRCKALSINVFEQDKYLYLRGQMEESMDIAKRQIQDVKNQAVNPDERFKLCHKLLAELPLIKTQSKEAADQLEAVAPELHPSELHSEREKILRSVETLASWERSVTDDTKRLEAKFLLRLQFNSELPALTQLLEKTREGLEGLKPVGPDERAVDAALQKRGVIRRNVESGMRVLEGLAEREKVDVENYEDLYSLRDAAMKECDSLMVSLSQAREALKDYRWAARGAVACLHDAEATVLAAPGGFLDCSEERKQTQQALKELEDVFQAHISNLVELVPRQRCISQPETELLHSSVLSRLLVGRAVLEAQAQLRLDRLQRCEIRQQSLKQSHEAVRRQVSEFETRLSELAAERVTSYDECITQQQRAKLLLDDLHGFVGKMEDLGTGCPTKGCRVGKDGDLGALWRRWASLWRAVGLLMAHSEQKGEEWKDITMSLEQCCSHVASLQAELPDSSSVSLSQEEPQELLAQAEMHWAGLEQEQQALLSLEHRLEHTLNSSAPHESIKTLVKIQESLRSLKERNRLLLAAAQAEEREREQNQEDLGEVEEHLFAILPELEVCSDPRRTQEVQQRLFSLKNKLKSITDSLQSRHAEIPADIGRQIQEVQQSLQKAEEVLSERNNPVRKLAGRVKDLSSGLERVKTLLGQRSSTLGEAQNVLKHVWDELDAWHSSLMLLESEVQDLAEDHPNKAQVLMDQLTEPLQLYQNAAQMAEQRTAFLSKIPACLQEFEDIIHRAACWLAEAQAWLSAPCSFTTAKSLHNHAKYLKLIQDDSERIRHTLQDFRSVLAEISTVCDISAQEERLDQSDQEVLKMQSSIMEPLDHLLQAAAMVGDVEVDLKTMEKNVKKIGTILSSMDATNVTLTERLHSRRVILASLQSMWSRLQDMDRCKEEIHLPDGAEKLLVFSRATQLLQQLEELEQVAKEQVSLLENKIKEEDRTSENLSFTSVSDFIEETQQLEAPAHTRFVQQEAFDVSYSEEEEDEEDESCHSSSSDTLTCSIPEDLEETLHLSDVQHEGVAEVKELDNAAHQFSLEAEMSLGDAATSLSSVKPEFGSQNAETGLTKLDNVPEAKTDDYLNPESVASAERQIEAAASETLNFDPQMETRLIPVRPITPFRKASDELREDEDKHPSVSTVPLSDQKLFSVSLSEGSQQPEEFAEAEISSAGREEEGGESQRARLHHQILTKLSSLRNVLEEQQSKISSEDGGISEQVQGQELASTGSVSSVLQQIQESVIMLRQMVVGSDCSRPGVQELWEAARRILGCLDSLPDFLLVCGADQCDPQLRRLQQQCVSAQLGALAELLGKVDSEVTPTLLRAEPEARSCLTGLQDCLQAVQLVLNSSHSQQVEHSGLQDHQELSSNVLRLLDESETGQSQIFSNLKDAPSLECAHLRGRAGEKLELQNASRSLLRGIACLLEMGEECLIERRTGQVPNHGKLQAVLCRHKKLPQVLRSQLSFLQYLFQREPDSLKGQEDEWMQLEVRAKARQQQALEQEVASEKRLQDWICWEGLCGRLGRVLDESEALISGGEPEGDEDDDEEGTVQRRLDACERALLCLDEGGVVLGTLLDQKKLLQAEPWFAASVTQAGGALELRWRGAYRRTEQEIQRFKDIQDIRARFQTDFSLVSERLLGASKHLKTLSGPADSSDLSQESVQSTLVKLLDLSVELEATSALRESVSKEATELLHLREADSPNLRTQLAQMEASCSQMTSDLSRIQDQLQQRLTAAAPPLKLLSELEDWLKRTEALLNQEKEQILKAKNAAEFAEILQKYQVLRKALVNGHLLLDFMSQPGPLTAAADGQSLGSERTAFAENLGALRSQWLHLQRELEKQVCDVEDIHHTCAEREKHLQKLHGWMERQKKQLNQWKRPTSQALAHNALPEWEAAVGRVKEVSAALRELKTTRVHCGKEEKHPSDVAFAEQAARVSRACWDLSQQMEALRPALQQTVDEWTFFQRALGDVTLFATRVRCALQRQKAPLFSLRQAEGYSDFLQELQVKVEAEEEQLWAAVDKSCQKLVEALHQGAAWALGDKVEEERKRWRNTVQEIKDEREKSGETFRLWKEYSRLSDSCSHRLQHLWADFSSPSPEKDPQATLCSLKGAAEELQSGVGDVLEVSKHLIGQLEPLASKLIRSEARLLTRDVLLLNQAVSRKTESLEVNLEQRKKFQTRLEALEEQMQKIKTDTCDTDSAKQVLLELSDLVPSLVDIREMSGFIAPDKQERERVDSLSRRWVENMTLASDRNRELSDELQHSQDFQEKCEMLKSIQEKLERDSVCRKPPSHSNLQETLSVHQGLQAEILVGHQLLHRLLCEAVESAEKEPAEKRSELVMQMAHMKKSWFSSVALAEQNWTVTKDRLQRWRIYHRGSESLKKLWRTVDSLLPPTGPCLYTLQQLQNCKSLYQRVEDLLDRHAPVFTQTAEAGERLSETMMEPDRQSQLQSELQDMKNAWQQITVQLGTNKDLVNTAVQMWSECQRAVTNIQSDLNQVRQELTGRPGDSEEPLTQETELSLQGLSTGLKELDTMKTDLSQYVAASDSALLEQQLEQLRCQWEELCVKVSLRRQEMADRLNAWTIFNDKNKEFCDWLTQMEKKVCRSGELSVEEMVEKLKKDCMEEINLFSENKSHLKQLGEQLLLASDEAKQSQVRGSLQEVNQRWHNLFHHVEARVKKLRETLVTMQQLDKNMSNLRSWLSRIEAELSRPVTYGVCHEQEIQRWLAEHQELQRDIEQHTEGVASVLSLCDVLLRDEDAAGGAEAESDSLRETSRSLDQRWTNICALAQDRRLRIEETWTLWCKFLNDYSRFEDWLKTAERTAASPNSADVLYSVAKEELKKFEGFQRQVHERLTQLELVNNQYRRLARENRTDRAEQLRATVSEGNRRWDTLQRRVGAVLRRLKYFTSQREEFEGTRESMLVWLTELDLKLTNVEHFSESDVHQKIQQLNSFQKEIALNTERIDGLIVFGEALIQKSSPQDAALIEDELEELHSYCQEVFSRLVRFHQRLSQPPMVKEEPELSHLTFSLESSLELIGRAWLGRSLGSLPATPTHLLTSPLERSGRETPVSVDSLPLEWDHTGDVGGSSSHEDEEEEEEEEEGAYFSALSVSNRSLSLHDCPRWRPAGDAEDAEDMETTPTLTSTPLKQGYLSLTSEDTKTISLVLDDEEQQEEEFGLTGLNASDKQSGVIQRWELTQAQSRCSQQAGPQEPHLDDITSWLESVIPELDRRLRSDPVSIKDMEAKAKELKEMEKAFSHYKSIMLMINLQTKEAPELQEKQARVNRDWSKACTGLQRWDASLRRKLIRCQEFDESLHSLLLWLAHTESRCCSVDVNHPETTVGALQQHNNTLTELQEELRGRRAQQASLQALWSLLQPEDAREDREDAQEKLHVTSNKLQQLLRQVDQDLLTLQQRLEPESTAAVKSDTSQKGCSTQRERRDSSPPRSFFCRLLHATFPLLLLLLLLPCLIPLSDSNPGCTVTNNFARSFYPMLHYTNGPPPT